MTATEYLGQAYRLDQRINSKLQQVESLRSLTRKVTASYDGETVFHTRNVTSLEDTIFRLMEAEEELNRQIDELVVLKMDISRMINRVRNESLRLILEKRYLCFLDSEMKYFCRSWLMQLGMGGADFKATRAALLNHLQGYAAFRTADRMAAHRSRYAGLRKLRKESEESNHEEN